MLSLLMFQPDCLDGWSRWAGRRLARARIDAFLGAANRLAVNDGVAGEAGRASRIGESSHNGRAEDSRG
jgi:hypothetical protein